MDPNLESSLYPPNVELQGRPVPYAKASSIPLADPVPFTAPAATTTRTKTVTTKSGAKPASKSQNPNNSASVRR